MNSSYSSLTLTHLYFAMTQTNGTIGDSRKSTPSPLAHSQKTIHQAPADPAACASALSANRLNPNPNSTHTSILALLLLSLMTEWHILGTQPCNPSAGGA